MKYKLDRVITTDVVIEVDEDVNMVKVDNLNGNFTIRGNEAELKTDSIHILGSLIIGNFVRINNINEIEKLYVEDDKQVNIKTENMNMFAKKANYQINNMKKIFFWFFFPHINFINISHIYIILIIFI